MSGSPGPVAADPIPLPQHIREYLARPLEASIATLEADGSPHLAITWYALDGDTLLINSRRERHWPRNLLRDPRISIAVPDPSARSHWVGVTGRAELLRDGNEATRDIMALATRYNGNPGEYRGQDRVTFRVLPERVFEYGP